MFKKLNTVLYYVFPVERLMFKQNTHQSRHHTLDRESTKCFFIAHHQQLAHLNGSLELLRFITCGLQALQ